MTGLAPGLSLATLLDGIRSLSATQFFVIDREGTFLHNASNPSRIGSNVFAVFPNESEPLRRALAGEELRWRSEFGDRVLSMAATPLRENGVICGVLGFATDITEQARAEERLAHTRQRLEHVFRSNMMAMMFWDDSGTIVDANAAFLALSGFTAEDLSAGAIDTRCLRTEAFAEEDAHAQEQIAASGVCTPYEKLLVTKDGLEVPVLVGGSRFEKSARAGVGFVLDRREHKEQEAQRERLHAQLLQVQKLESLGLLAGGIAHDFNNLLTAILGGTSTALLTLADESPARPDLENVLEASRRAADLTRQMLAYSGKGHFDVRPVDLSATVREITSLLETTLHKKVQLRLELLEDLPTVLADVAQLQQVIMNLVINGAEAIGDQTGTVLVTTGTQLVDEHYTEKIIGTEPLSTGTYVFLEIHDTGCGMSEETQARIFDPFFTTKFTGRGLGLAAVQGIVRGHKGAIRVYSTPGRGTTFKLLLPASREKVRPVAPRAREYSGDGLVLIIDDDASVRRTAARIFTLFGFSVLEAEDGRVGLNLFERHRKDVVLVLLDMTMPVLSGEETFRGLRSIDDSVPVLLTSGYNEIEATRRFTTKGLAGFLQKPFTPGDLAAKLKLVLTKTCP